MTYQFHTEPYAHQKKAFELSCEKDNYALLMEMGTGKSKVVVDTAAYLYSLGRITGVLLVAPKGVHSKWASTDFPFSLPPAIEYTCAVWRSGDAKAISKCEELFERGNQLRVLCMNIDVFSAPKSPGVALAKRFLQVFDSMLVIDESTRIKNPGVNRTKTIMKLGDLAKYKRILTGTPVTNNVFDLYSQFSFLDFNIFGQSFISFKHQYAEILDERHPTMQAIRARGARFLPTIVATDEYGRPKYKNLDMLQKKIAPHSFRVTKDECLDLPPKIYETIEYEMDKEQAHHYQMMKEKARVILQDDVATVSHKMIQLLRLQQIVSGFVPTDNGELHSFFNDPKDNPRIKTLMECLEDIDGQVIIWARFQEEIRQLAKVFEGECVTYYGETKDREHALHLYTTGQVRYLIGNAATGGIGLNLTNASTVVYYSNDFSLENRLQSEDRAHRIGQKNSVVYFDLIATGTVDKHILDVVKGKKTSAEAVLDFAKEG